MEGICRSLVAAITLARGDSDVAWAEAQRAEAAARPTKDPQTVNPALAFKALVALAVGETAAAGELADELVAAWRSIGIRQPHELSIAPLVFSELGRADEVLAALDAESRAITPWHEAARLLASGEYVRAADLFAEIGTVPDEAYVRLQAAKAFAAAGDRASADVQLGLAQPAFTQLGASAWAAEGKSLLGEDGRTGEARASS